MKVFYPALVTALVLMTGCAHRSIIRDARVYEAELNQYDNWAVQQAKYLRGFIEEHCECESDAEGPQFMDEDCEKAADFVLTIEARHEWHKQMSLWNAGLVEEEPAQDPPVIPALSCPLDGSDEARIEAEEAAAEATVPDPEPEAASPSTEEE